MNEEARSRKADRIQGFIDHQSVRSCLESNESVPGLPSSRKTRAPLVCIRERCRSDPEGAPEERPDAATALRLSPVNLNQSAATVTVAQRQTSREP